MASRKDITHLKFGEGEVLALTALSNPVLANMRGAPAQDWDLPRMRASAFVYVKDDAPEQLEHLTLSELAGAFEQAPGQIVLRDGRWLRLLVPDGGMSWGCYSPAKDAVI